MCGQGQAPAPLPRERPGTHCIGDWVGPRAGPRVAENLAPTGIRSPDLPARSQSLYRLSYPGQGQQIYRHKNLSQWFSSTQVEPAFQRRQACRPTARRISLTVRSHRCPTPRIKAKSTVTFSDTQSSSMTSDCSESASPVTFHSQRAAAT